MSQAIGETSDNEPHQAGTEAALSGILITSIIVTSIVVVNLIIATLTSTYDASKKMSEQTRRKQHAGEYAAENVICNRSVIRWAGEEIMARETQALPSKIQTVLMNLPT